MKRILQAWILPLVLIGAAGCTSEEDASEVILLVTPSARQAVGGEKIYFDIETRTINGYVDRLDIDSFDAVTGQQQLLSERPAVQSYTTRYVYAAPVFAVDSVSVELTFTAADDCGYVRRSNLRIAVRNSAAPLVERSAYTLYSPESGKFDGFSLDELRPLRNEETVSGFVDLYVSPSPDSASETMMREWRSLTGVRFAKVNTFDYAGATRASVASLYENTRCDDFVADLAIDDIVLLGRDDRALGLLKIMAVYDEAGCENDRFVFNLKVVE